jgi:cytoskeletal protein CcmA (bactofilin family)
MNLRSIATRLHREEGIAMVIALMVSFVVLTLSIVVVGQSIHSLEASSYDRERTLSVHAAEAGINDWFHYLQATPIESYACSARTGTLDTSGTATFSATATFLDGSEVAMNCPFSQISYPTYVLIRSEGRANGDVPRTIETFVRLTPQRGGFDAAVLSVRNTTFEQNVSVSAAEGASDGDVYVLDGDLVVTQSMSVSGSVYVPYGGASIGNNTVIVGDLWVRDDVDLQNPAVVEGDVLSTTGDVYGDGHIFGDVVAAGTVDTSNLDIEGVSTQATVVDDVPTQTFPQITGNTTIWTNAGYTLVNAADLSVTWGTNQCYRAYEYIKNRWGAFGYASGNIVVRITDGCTFKPPAATVQKITLRGNLAILSDGGYEFRNQINWLAGGTVPRDLFLISTYKDPATCASNDPKDIYIGNRATFEYPYVSVLFYTPCAAEMNNQNNFSGQVMGGTVDVGMNFSMEYRPVYVPSMGTITGFDEDISYVREI